MSSKPVGNGNNDMNTKQLHKHSVPVVLLSVGLLLVSVLGMSQLILSSGHSNNNLSQLLSERLFNIQPSANGLFRISRYQPDAQANSGLLLTQNTSTGLGVTSSTGAIAELNTTLNTINQTVQ